MVGAVLASLRPVLGLSSLAFALGGVVAPDRIARVARISRRTAQLLALRDLVVGIALFRSGPVGLLARGISDAGDTVLFARRRPWVAALAAGSTVANVTGAVLSRRRPAPGRA